MKTKDQDKTTRAASSAAAVPVRAEGLSWPIGAAFLIVLVLTYGAGVWWMARGLAVQQRDGEIAKAQAVADNLATALEPLLASGDLSAARRLLTHAAYQNEFTVCQLRLTNGSVLIDSDLSRDQPTVMPVAWEGRAPAVPVSEVIGGRVVIDRPIDAIGRGEATLTLEKTVAAPTAAYAAVAPGAGAVGALGLIGMLLIYRQIRSRLQTLNLIRNTLIHAGKDEEDSESALLDPRMGPEAQGWNRLLIQKRLADEAESAIRLEQLGEVVGGGGVLEAACNVVWHGMVVIEPSGSIAYANGAAVSMLGQSETITNRPATQVIPDPSVAEAIEDAVAGNGPARVTREISRAEGDTENHLRYTVRRMTGERGGVVLLIEDVTQQRIAERSRHDFVARATHELRTPLTNIRLYVETAQDEGERDATLRGECLNVISRESQRLERLVGEMLSVSEIEAGTQEIKHDDVRLDTVFNELESDYAAKSRDKRITLGFDLPPKLPVIQGDREKLDIVLQNLVGNALKYTPEGGQVTVLVEVSATELVVEISDTGIGISEDDLPKVFEKFYRANDARLGDITGSGLGLALAQEIVRLHGGELTASSALNEGSTFRMALPIRVEGV
ncbi:MAG: ATP-binding protein [Planctomycetota bacterium]